MSIVKTRVFWLIQESKKTSNIEFTTVTYMEPITCFFKRLITLPSEFSWSVLIRLHPTAREKCTLTNKNPQTLKQTELNSLGYSPILDSKPIFHLTKAGDTSVSTNTLHIHINTYRHTNTPHISTYTYI